MGVLGAWLAYELLSHAPRHGSPYSQMETPQDEAGHRYWIVERRSTMRPSNKLATFAFVVLLGTSAQAQVKDMPSQAEFDPI